MFFCDWFTSLSINLQVSFMVVICVRILFFVQSKWYSIICIYYILLDTWVWVLSCGYYNSASQWTQVDKSLWDPDFKVLRGMCTVMKLVSLMGALCWFLRSCHSVLHSDHVILHPTSRAWYSSGCTVFHHCTLDSFCFAGYTCMMLYKNLD